MAKEVSVKATQDQWQWVMWYLGSAQMPAKLGEKTYNATMRARIQGELSEVFDALQPHSYYMQQHGSEYQPLFGAKDDWKVVDPAPGSKLDQINPKKTYTITFGEKAVSGLLWLFTILLTPSEPISAPDGRPMFDPATGQRMMSHPTVTPALASRFVWPITVAVNRVVQLKRSVGIVEEATNWDEAPAKAEVAR